MSSSPLRSIAALAAVVLGSLMLSLSLAVVWLHEVVIDSNRYVDTVTPLAQDPAVKNAVADYATEDLFRQIDVEQIVRITLPEDNELAVSTAAGALKGSVYRQIRQVLDTPEFTDLWKSSNREAHSALLTMMRDNDGTIASEEGKVLIDISRVFELVKANLSAAGIDILDDVQIEAGHRFTIFQFPALSRAQRGFKLLEGASLWLPVASFIFLVAGVWLAANRRLAFAGIGVSLAAFLAILYLGVGSLRDYYLDAVIRRGNIDVPAAGSFYDVMVSPLQTLVKGSLIGAAVIAVGALAAILLAPRRI